MTKTLTRTETIDKLVDLFEAELAAQETAFKEKLASVVPEERQEYVAGAFLEHRNNFNEGFNAARQEVLTRIEKMKL